MRKLVYSLNINVDFYFSKCNNMFIIKTFLGISYFFLPSYYFFLFKNNKMHFLFLNKLFFKGFISNFFINYINLNNLYIMRLKIRGLGYQIFKLNKAIYCFIFNSINFYYLFLPVNIICHWYKKRILFLSNDLVILKLIFTCILLLKKLGPYRILGIKYPRQVILLKKGGKTKTK